MNCRILPRFGPIYGNDQPLMVEAKDKAWKKVVPGSESPEDNYTFELFLDAIRSAEIEARDTYPVNIACESYEFGRAMIRDGCFFLHLAFLILGKSSALNYPADDPIFGRKQNRRKIHNWVNSMFFVGNQIPLVVLKELLKQDFFQDVIAKTKMDWSPPVGLCKRVLYQQLIEPELDKIPPPKSVFDLIPWKKAKNLVFALIPWKKAKNRAAGKQPCDILHALQIILLGSTPSVNHLSVDDEDGYYDDVISGQETTPLISTNEIHAPPITIKQTTAPPLASGQTNPPPIATEHGDQHIISTADSIIISLLNKLVSRDATDVNQTKRIFLSATEIKQSGIHIRKLRNGGIRSIKFKNYYVSAYLYLPVLQVDDTSEMIFHHLKRYEKCQPLWRHKCELGSYLRLMSDLIQTPEDVRVLKENGIIEGHYEYAEPEIFSRLSTSDGLILTQELRDVRSKIADYSSPWIHYRPIINLVAFFTVLQAFLALPIFDLPNRSLWLCLCMT